MAQMSARIQQSHTSNAEWRTVHSEFPLRAPLPDVWTHNWHRSIHVRRNTGSTGLQERCLIHDGLSFLQVPCTIIPLYAPYRRKSHSECHRNRIPETSHRE